MAFLQRHQLPPLLLAFLLAASFHCFASGENYYRSLCQSRPSTCGSVSINYPFYLYNKTAVIRGYDRSSCGYPGFEVRCDDGKQAVLLIGDETYNVSNINYTANTVSLIDQEVFKDERCPRVDHNVTLPVASWLNNSADYLVFFVNCNPAMAREVQGISPINCSSFGGQPFFVLPGNEVPSGKLVQACPRVIQVPVLELPDSPWNDSEWRNGGYRDALRRGFGLAWDQRKVPACFDCEQSNGKCGYNQDAGFIACLCADGRVESQNCRPYSSSKPFQA